MSDTSMELLKFDQSKKRALREIPCEFFEDKFERYVRISIQAERYSNVKLPCGKYYKDLQLAGRTELVRLMQYTNGFYSFMTPELHHSTMLPWTFLLHESEFVCLPFNSASDAKELAGLYHNMFRYDDSEYGTDDDDDIL